jgi:ABC-type phosphate/phosphonate transport system substrate-binding protein
MKLYHLLSKKHLLLIGLLALLIRLTSGEAAFADEEQVRRFSIGYTANTFFGVDIKDAAAAIDVWGKEMAHTAGLVGESHIYYDIESMIKDFKEKKIETVVVRSIDYLRIRDRIDSSLGLSQIKGGKKTVKYLLITRVDSNISDIRDLNKKKIAILKNDDLGQIFLDLLLLRAKKPEAKQYFSDIDIKTKPSQVLLSVFFGQNDACLVNENVLITMSQLNPQIEKKLKIIQESPGLVEGLSIFRRELPESYKKKVLDVGCNLDRTPRGKQILLLFKMDGTFQLFEKDLDSLKKLLAEYDRLKGKS